jgi:hypothetical protein
VTALATANSDVRDGSKVTVTVPDWVLICFAVTPGTSSKAFSIVSRQAGQVTFRTSSTTILGEAANARPTHNGAINPKDALRIARLL